MLLGLRAQRDLSPMQEDLLEGYASAGERLDPSLLGRCRTLALLRLACIHQDGRLAERAAQQVARGAHANATGTRLDARAPVRAVVRQRADRRRRTLEPS